MIRRLILVAAAVLVAAACDKTGGETVTPLGVPQNVVLHGATETSLTFQWIVVEGATGYAWKLTLDGALAKEGSVSSRNVIVSGLSKGTTYGFSVCAVKGTEKSAYSTEITAKTLGTAPVDGGKVCVDAPVVIEFDSTPVLGTSGLIRVLKADGTEVDKIDLSDIATVDILSDGTMIPKGADADNGKIAINNDYVYNTFMDALHSGQYRVVHYTPLRVSARALEIKLHNEALDYGTTYTVEVDESVVGKPVEDITFTTKAKPSGDVVRVAADGSGDFCTVQGALSFVSANVGKDAAVTIEVANGTYRELLFLRNMNNVTIKGASRSGVVIAYPNNDSYETGSGSSKESRPSLGGSIGKSGGRSLFLVELCDNLVLENLTIENTYSIPSHKGQAEAIYFNSAHRLTVENCSLISWQDTFQCKGKVWVHNSLIAGHCDYIWGGAEACLFEDCEIRSRAAGYIVQARVQSASNKGFVFLNCRLTAEDGVGSGKMYLARSAGPDKDGLYPGFDNVVYVNCTMEAVIRAEGWLGNPAPNPSTPTATSGWREYGSKGEGASSARNSFGKMLSTEEASIYCSRQDVLGW